jgi:toxin FitB
VTGWLLNTNVSSELVRTEPHPAVVAFVERAVPAFVSAVSLHELRFGVERLPGGRRRDDLRCWPADLETAYQGAIIAVGPREADAGARLRAAAARRGRQVQIADGLIAGTAVEHGLMVATRDAAGFGDLGVTAADSWRKGRTRGTRDEKAGPAWRPRTAAVATARSSI